MTVTPPRSAAAWICRRWVDLYTRSLPESEQRRRRDELDSDLFEHALEARTAGVGAARLNAEILARVLVGMPADLSWRRATRRPQPRLVLGGSSMSLPESTSRRLLYGLSGLIAVYGSYGLLSAIGIVSAGWNDGVMSKLLFEGVPTLSAIALVAGLVIQSKNPGHGLPLIIAGAIGPAVWFWMLLFYGPVMIAVIALAVSITPRKEARLAAT